MFLQDKVWVPVLHWDRRTQLGTESRLLYLIPSCNRTQPSNHLKQKKRKQQVWDSAFEINFKKIKLFIKQSYLPLIPVGRNSQVDTEIQFCCQLGLGLRHPSHRETQQHRLPKAQSNLLSHKTGQPDTLDTHLQTHNDSSDLSPNCETSYLPCEINHHLSGTMPLSQSCLSKTKTIEDTILILNRSAFD